MKLKLHFAALAVAFTLSGMAQTSENEPAARQWISAHAKDLGIRDFHTFKLDFVRTSLSGETLRFQQMVNDVPVFKSEIVIHFSTRHKITSTTNSYDSNAASINTMPAFSKEEAIAKSNEALKITGTISFQECKLFVYDKIQGTKLVYRVITDSQFRTGSWETIIDAKTGAILSTKDVAVYHKKKNVGNEIPSVLRSDAQNPEFVSGTGMIYNPDPLSVAQVAYAGNYRDLNDAANAQLNAARSSVVLNELEFAGGVYKLKGSYAEIKDLEAPTKGLFTQATSDFSFDRSNDAFEAVNAYYHIDKSLRYINETLGIVCKPLNHNGIVWYDPSSVNGDDNSYYSDGSLNYGEGGVDDAEDADVILHELGHGIHDWITNGGLSQEDGLSEGCGDYWAMSYSRSLNQWPSSAAAYNWVFSWDGHNQYWDGRTTNTTKMYPVDLDGEEHDDGEIWSAVMMQVFDQLGKTKTDVAFLEGLSMTNSSTNQPDAALAIRQAAIDMNYPCEDINAITTIFNDRGYALPGFDVSIGCPDTQTVYVAPGANYSVVNFASLSNAISENCDAVVTQNPAVGASLAAGTYQVTMTATGETTSNCSFTLQVMEQLSVGESHVNDFTVYPNPTSGMLTLQGDFDSNENISIYNMLGQKVMASKIDSSEKTINVSQLPEGVYSIYFNVAKTARKFIKQ